MKLSTQQQAEAAVLRAAMCCRAALRGDNDGTSRYARQILHDFKSGSSDLLCAAICFAHLGDAEGVTDYTCVAVGTDLNSHAPLTAMACIAASRDQQEVAQLILLNGWERLRTRLPVLARRRARKHYMMASRPGLALDALMGIAAIQAQAPPGRAPWRLEALQDRVADGEFLRDDISSASAAALEGSIPLTAVAVACASLPEETELTVPIAYALAVAGAPGLFARPDLGGERWQELGEISSERYVEALMARDLDITSAVTERQMSSPIPHIHFQAANACIKFGLKQEPRIQSAFSIAMKPRYANAYMQLSTLVARTEASVAREAIFNNFLALGGGRLSCGRVQTGNV